MVKSLLSLVPVLAITTAYVLFSGQSLPPTVASHFGAGGRADGFMSREAYLGMMSGLVVGVPLFIALIHSLVRAVPPSLVNLPNRDYWLAPERAEETFAFLHRHGVYFALLMAVFFAYVHRLIVLAHEVDPPRLSSSSFAMAMVVFFVAVAVWVGVLIFRFRRAG